MIFNEITAVACPFCSFWSTLLSGTITSDKLQEELGNARQELQKLKKTSDSKIENLRKELQEIKKNFIPLGTTKNVTTKVCKFLIILVK